MKSISPSLQETYEKTLTRIPFTPSGSKDSIEVRAVRYVVPEQQRPSVDGAYLLTAGKLDVRTTVRNSSTEPEWVFVAPIGTTFKAHYSASPDSKSLEDVTREITLSTPLLLEPRGLFTTNGTR